MSSLFDIEGRVALVTGGSRGIGLMIAEGLVKAGARVYITSRKADACEEAARALGEQGWCASLPADLSRPAEIQRLAGMLEEREHSLHLLVNNAGATWGAPLEEYPEDAFDKLWAINVKAAFNLVRALRPRLSAGSRPQNPARVVNVGSIDGLRVPPFESYAYSATKAALHMMTRHLAARLVKDGILVNAVAPGYFASKMTAFLLRDEARAREVTERIPLGRWGEAEEIAGTVQFLASRAGGYIVGAVLAVDGGVAALG
jgi:NAD(P)-dependent dehydrogenase (short-subunit alcohol dehydrogenase family)